MDNSVFTYTDDEVRNLVLDLYPRIMCYIIDLDAQIYIPQCSDPESQKLWDSYVCQTNSAHTIAFSGRQKDNQVLINVWNWDDDWSLVVTENGIKLPVSRIRS